MYVRYVIKGKIYTYTHTPKVKQPQTNHHAALICQELKPESRPLSQLVLRPSADKPTHRGQPPNSSFASITPNRIIKQQNEKYINYWKKTIKTQSKLQCYLALKREFTLANYLSMMDTPKLRNLLSKCAPEIVNISFSLAMQKRVILISFQYSPSLRFTKKCI